MFLQRIIIWVTKSEISFLLYLVSLIVIWSRLKKKNKNPSLFQDPESCLKLQLNISYLPQGKSCVVVQHMGKSKSEVFYWHRKITYAILINFTYFLFVTFISYHVRLYSLKEKWTQYLKVSILGYKRNCLGDFSQFRVWF